MKKNRKPSGREHEGWKAWAVCQMCARRCWLGGKRYPAGYLGVGGALCQHCQDSPAGKWFREDAGKGHRWGHLYK